MKKVPRMMSNSRCKEIFAGKDLGQSCSNCKFYDESHGVDLAVCKKTKMLTVVAALCSQWEEKKDA